MAVPLVSIILPTYNRSGSIGRSIASLLAQTEWRFEIVVVDDGSTDDTRAIVESIDDHRIRYLRGTANRGAPAARNLGIRAAVAPLIAFQDSDDEWEPDKLRKQLRVLAESPPEVGVVYCDMWRIRRHGPTAYFVSPTIVRNRYIDPESGFYQTYCLGIQTTVVKRQVLAVVGGLDEALGFYDDLELFLRVAQACELRRIAEPLVRYHDTGGLVHNWRQELADRRHILGRHGAAVFREDARFWMSERTFLAARTILGPAARSWTQRQRNLSPARTLPTAPPTIGPPPPRSPRPFWSVVIPVYCPQRDQFTAALTSVLQQDSGPAEMQIAVFDDGSPHFEAEQWCESIAPGRVECHRRPSNGGLASAWNACVNLAAGKWVHLLHQDDLVLPGFYARLQRAVRGHSGLGAAYVQHHVMDGCGRLDGTISRNRARRPGVVENWVEMVFEQLSFQAPAIVVRREAYERLGGFRTDFRYALDWDMWKRVAAAYPIWYDPTPLAAYRRHQDSASTRLLRLGDNIDELRRSIELSKGYLPADESERMAIAAARNLREIVVDDGLNGLFTRRDWRIGLAQLRGARQLGGEAWFVGMVLRRLLAGVGRWIRGGW